MDKRRPHDLMINADFQDEYLSKDPSDSPPTSPLPVEIDLSLVSRPPLSSVIAPSIQVAYDLQIPSTSFHLLGDRHPLGGMPSSPDKQLILAGPIAWSWMINLTSPSTPMILGITPVPQRHVLSPWGHIGPVCGQGAAWTAFDLVRPSSGDPTKPLVADRIIKVYVPSRFPAHTDIVKGDYEYSERDVRMMIKVELNIYHGALRDLQGVAVPRVHDVYLGSAHGVVKGDAVGGGGGGGGEQRDSGMWAVVMDKGTTLDNPDRLLLHEK